MNAAREPDARPGETPATMDELIDEAWRERAHDLSRLDALALQLLASAGTDPRARGHGLTLQALRMVQLGRADEADGLIAQAQGLFDSVGDLRGQCLVRDVVASRLILQGRCEEALATIGPNLERAAGERNAHDEFLSWSRAALAADHLGRFEDGLRFVYRQLASAQRSGDAALLAQSLGAIGGAHAEWLNLDDAEPLCRQAYQLARGQAWTQPGLTAYLSWGVILVLRGRHVEATAVAYEIIEALANQPTFQNWRNPLLVAWIFAHAGDHGAAQAWLDRGLALAPSPDAPPVEWVKTQAMVWVRQGRHADARRICQAHLSVLDPQGLNGPSSLLDLLQLHEVLAEALAALGDYREALAVEREAGRVREQLSDLATRSRRVAMQIEFELAEVGRERDEAKRREQAAETARVQLADLNHALQAANAAKTRFLAAASHDLRQPVHALALQTAALRHELNTPRQFEMLASMERCAGSLSTMFDTLLDLSRMDSGALLPHRQPFALAELLLALVEELLPVAQARGLRLGLRIGGHDPGAAGAFSDYQLLETLLRNLIGNAIKYTEQGSVLVCARRWRGAAGEPLWRLQVWDTGVGIAEADTQRVFDEFYQVGNPARRRAEGLGLGLAIVQRLARLLEHPITLRSAPGRGSCFEVRVPAIAEPAPARLTAIQIAPRLALHVAVIEDDPDARDAMRNLLLKWGCEVSVGESADDVLAQLTAPHAGLPDTVLADFRLPGARNGAEEVERLRSMLAARLGGEPMNAARTATMPALILTGDLAPATLQLLDQQQLAWLPKPAPVLRLAAWLAQVEPRTRVR